MNNINRFLAEFKDEFQRSAYFVCQIHLNPLLRQRMLADAANHGPASLAPSSAMFSSTNGGSERNLQETIQLMAEGWLVSDVRLPDRGFGLTDMSMYGITEHFPYHAEFSPLECQFITPLMASGSQPDTTTGRLQPGADNPVPRMFSYWQNQIQKITRGPEDGLDFAFPADYYSRVTLTALDRQLRGTTAWQFEKVFPNAVGTAQLSWAQTDSFTILPVQFTYSYWTMVSLPALENMSQDGSELQEAKLFQTNPRFRLALNIGRPRF